MRGGAGSCCESEVGAWFAPRVSLLVRVCLSLIIKVALDVVQGISEAVEGELTCRLRPLVEMHQGWPEEPPGSRFLPWGGQRRPRGECEVLVFQG